MLRISLLAPFAVAALIAGCGSSSTTTSSGAAASSSAAATGTSSSSTAAGAGGGVSLSETEFKITPATPAVGKTGTVTITVKNSGKVTHALAVVTPAGVVKTGPIAPGATATLNVNAAKAGKYTFYCPIPGHRMLGMQGTLVVGGASASASAGGSTPASSTSTSSSSGYGY
jgi:uncharacterized cupredoxin-like copper-binding protein